MVLGILCVGRTCGCAVLLLWYGHDVSVRVDQVFGKRMRRGTVGLIGIEYMFIFILLVYTQ